MVRREKRRNKMIHQLMNDMYDSNVINVNYKKHRNHVYSLHITLLCKPYMN